MTPGDLRQMQGRVVLATNSVLFVAKRQGAPAALDAFVADLVAHGCAVHAQSDPCTRVLYRFDTFVAPLLPVVQAAAESGALAVSATMAVKVRVDGRQRPSPRSVDVGSTLAAEAGPGRFVLSLQLASLLQATEPECAGRLHAAKVRMADGRERAVALYSASTGTGRTSVAGAGQMLGRLPEEVGARLAERLSRRLQPFAPDIAVQDVRQVVAGSDSAGAIAQSLMRLVPSESHGALRLIVDDEVRWIRMRGGPVA